jgi:hypothetical protein
VETIFNKGEMAVPLPEACSFGAPSGGMILNPENHSDETINELVEMIFSEFGLEEVQSIRELSKDARNDLIIKRMEQICQDLVI